jgi:hypothetical protein
MKAPTVATIEPSPVHRRQWLLRFTCGHRVSVTSKIKPQARRYSCGDCWVRLHDRREVRA